MGVKAFFNYFYQGGKQASDWIVRTVSPEMDGAKAKKVSTAIDVGAGSMLTYFSGLSVLGWTTVAATAITTIATAPVAFVPAAVGTLLTSAVMGGLNLISAVGGLGFLSSGMDKLNIAKPKGAIASAKQTAGKTAQAVAKPFKWVGNKLSATFNKAHDGASKAPAATPQPAVSQPTVLQVAAQQVVAQPQPKPQL